MPEIAVLVKINVAPSEIPNLKEYRHKNMKALKDTVPGFQSLTVWQSTVSAQEHMILIGYENEESAEVGLQVSMDNGALVESLKNPNNIPEVHRGRISNHSGKRIEDNPVGSLASVSFRVAEPGFGDSLESELQRIFEELSVIEGYRGSLTFRNEGLDEEVVGIVFWLTTLAFEASLPDRIPYEVRLYRRTA